MIERDKEYYNQKIGELYSIIDNQEKIIKDLQEEKEKLKAQLDLYRGALKREEKAIHRANALEDKIQRVADIIELCKVKPTNFFKGLEGSLLMPREEVDKLLELLRGDNNE